VAGRLARLVAAPAAAPGSRRPAAARDKAGVAAEIAPSADPARGAPPLAARSPGRRGATSTVRTRATSMATGAGAGAASTAACAAEGDVF
jgi:hypothetical protein